MSVKKKNVTAQRLVPLYQWNPKMIYILNIPKWNAKWTKMEQAAGCSVLVSTFSMVKTFLGFHWYYGTSWNWAVMWCDVMWCDVPWCSVMWFDSTQPSVNSSVLYYAMYRSDVTCCTALHCTVLLHELLCNGFVLMAMCSVSCSDYIVQHCFALVAQCHAGLHRCAIHSVRCSVVLVCWVLSDFLLHMCVHK